MILRSGYIVPLSNINSKYISYVKNQFTGWGKDTPLYLVSAGVGGFQDTQVVVSCPPSRFLLLPTSKILSMVKISFTGWGPRYQGASCPPGVKIFRSVILSPVYKMLRVGDKRSGTRDRGTYYLGNKINWHTGTIFSFFHCD